MVTSNRHDRNIQREFERTKAVSSKEAPKSQTVPEKPIRPKKVQSA
jgi:hypothetical protein